MKKGSHTGTTVPKNQTFMHRVFKKNASPPEAHPSTVTSTDRNAQSAEKLMAYRNEKSLQHKNAESILKILKRHKNKLHSIGCSPYEFANITRREKDFKEVQKMIKKEHEYFTHEIIDFMEEKKIHPKNLGYTSGNKMLEQLVTFHKPGQQEYEKYRRKVAKLFRKEVEEAREFVKKK